MSEEQKVQRQFLVQRLYIKDISFESPKSPQIFQQQWTPEISVNLGNEMQKLDEGAFELVLKVTVEAKHEGKNVFLVEVAQAGVFVASGFSDEEFDALVGIAAPNVLFPYVREVISDLVSRGTFPQFVLQPVNFEALYHQQRQAKAAQAAAEATH